MELSGNLRFYFHELSGLDQTKICHFSPIHVTMMFNCGDEPAIELPSVKKKAKKIWDNGISGILVYLCIFPPIATECYTNEDWDGGHSSLYWFRRILWRHLQKPEGASWGLVEYLLPQSSNEMSCAIYAVPIVWLVHVTSSVHRTHQRSRRLMNLDVCFSCVAKRIVFQCTLWKQWASTGRKTEQLHIPWEIMPSENNKEWPYCSPSMLESE